MNLSPRHNRTPVLLFNAKFYGTLAAVRSLGRLGVPITVAESVLFAPARWSRFVSRRLPAPPIQDSDAFVHWLKEFGSRNPGHVLYPTSDEMAWLFAYHQETLGAYYHMYSPSVECIYHILNKQLLHAACDDLQITVPETYFPKSEEEVRALADVLPYPVMIKPQTQLFFETHTKGRPIENREQLLDSYFTFMERNRYSDDFLALYPDVKWPMLQRYYPEAADSIYNFSGFIDASGELIALRTSRKVLQKPRRLGIGVCFENETIEPLLAAKLTALCKTFGYYGVFEAEFIQRSSDGTYLFIDFNPRFYNQMAFDIARGLPLPEIVYYAAIGDLERLQSTVQAACETSVVERSVFCHQLLVKLMLLVQWFSGQSQTKERFRWQQWLMTNKAHMTDAVADPRDRLPALVEYLRIARALCRHPKGFIRQLS